MIPGNDSYQAARDGNRVTVATGQSNADSGQTLPFLMDAVTGRLLVSASGSTTSFVDSEVVSGSGTAWTLANTPTLGSVHLYANGQRLTPGGVDYTIAGAAITTITSWASGTVLADYRD